MKLIAQLVRMMYFITYYYYYYCNFAFVPTEKLCHRKKCPNVGFSCRGRRKKNCFGVLSMLRGGGGERELVWGKGESLQLK